MSTSSIRVRFAPSPTGLMHAGNIRIALMNYLFAQQKNGTFILRIEDTDAERIFDQGAQQILRDLSWLKLQHQEGPIVGGAHAPYFQSERTAIYQEKLDELIKRQKVYRCFCTTEELEKRRERQIALKQSPRYDRACLKLSAAELEQKLATQAPHIWRVELDHSKTVGIKDMVGNVINFELKNFSDFPVTRQDGSFTFIFANFVDDMVMEISHVIRGEDHLTNTANQAALYMTFGQEWPIYWHLPIICNLDGKKLSKRDFGFSLNDLRQAGFLPEAICNYLAITGGSYEQEIMDMSTLITTINFEHHHGSNSIKYDVEKLRWVNHKWIDQYDAAALTELCLPVLQEAYPTVNDLNKNTLTHLIQTIKSDLITLLDVVPALKFVFQEPNASAADITECVGENLIDTIKAIVKKHIDAPDIETLVTNIKQDAKQEKVPLKELFWFMRMCLMGTPQGPSVHDIMAMLGHERSKNRLMQNI